MDAWDDFCDFLESCRERKKELEKKEMLNEAEKKELKEIIRLWNEYNWT